MASNIIRISLTKRPKCTLAGTAIATDSRLPPAANVHLLENVSFMSAPSKIFSWLVARAGADPEGVARGERMEAPRSSVC